MPLPLAAPVATGVATAAASTGARSTLSNIFTTAVGGIARAFGFGQSGQSNSNDQENTTAITQQDTNSSRMNIPAAARATSYTKPSDTVENISRMGAALGNNNTRERQDVGDRLSGSGSVVSILASIDKNIQALTSFIFSTGGLGGGRGAPRELEVGRRSSFSPGAQADINGLIAAAALSAVGQVINSGAAAFQRGRENVPQANEQAAQNRTQLSERQQGGASPGQVMAGNQASRYTVSNEELANLQEMLETPEPGEDAANRELRERLDSQLTTLMNQENMGGGIRLTEEMVRYRRDRNNRDRTRTLQNSAATQPPMTVEQSIEPAEGSEGVERIINEYQEIQNNAITPPTPAGTERLPLREREPRSARNTQSEPSAFSRALSSAIPRFSLSNAMDVITGRNLSRSRAANAIDNEYTSTNINPVVETPMSQQAPTIINNNNIIQGGGQSQPSMSGETGTPSMPAGSGVPPMIGIAPTPPSSPAFYSYSN